MDSHKPTRILDTVHGYITLPWEYAVKFVDTPQFQRLRRIEQSAIRALFPTARHDRFMHSLGVYHIGDLIVNHFREEMDADYVPDKLKEPYRILFDRGKNDSEITASYKIACLLHDVGHSPFSHTLEEYFGGKDINNLRDDLFGSLEIDREEYEKFKNDYQKTIENKKLKPHEITSAIVCVRCYNNDIVSLNASIDYVVRMILGVTYLAPSDQKEQLANIFIELLHGETIDADRLDYACRDVWASGYSTSTIDMRRLIYAMHIRKEGDDFVLCYDDKVINEIESLLNIRDFQKEYIFNHHVIRYDQYLLEMAARKMARYFFPKTFYDKDGKTPLDDEERNQNKALACFINVDALTADYYSPKSKYYSDPTAQIKINDTGSLNIAHVADEDILFLMKQTESVNHFYKEWTSRQYQYYPLWKTRDEFHSIFPNSIGKKKPSLENITKEIIKALGIPLNSDSIRIMEVEFKSKTSLTDLKLWSNERIEDYQFLHPQPRIRPYPRSRHHEYMEREDCIVFVYYKNQFGKEEYKEREKERKELIKKLIDPINNFYKALEV